MTDAEIVRECAEKVMGWPFVSDLDPQKLLRDLPPCPFFVIRHDAVEVFTKMDASGSHARYWDPLTSDEDNAQVLDKMVEDGYDYEVSAGHAFAGGKYSINFHLYSKQSSFPCGYRQGDDRKRCVVLAALKAKGVEIA